MLNINATFPSSSGDLLSWPSPLKSKEPTYVPSQALNNKHSIWVLERRASEVCNRTKHWRILSKRGRNSSIRCAEHEFNLSQAQGDGFIALTAPRALQLVKLKLWRAIWKICILMGTAASQHRSCDREDKASSNSEAEACRGARRQTGRRRRAGVPQELNSVYIIPPITVQ